MTSSNEFTDTSDVEAGTASATLTTKSIAEAMQTIDKTEDPDPWAAEEAHTNAAKEAAAEKYDPLDNDAVNQAADVFQKSLPRIKSLAANLKGGALYRVFKSVMEFPLADKEPKFLSNAENELFVLCLSATMAKSTMLQAMAAERARENKAAQEAALGSVELKQLTPEEMKKGTTDGSSN